jgi:phenylpyruvate tautomerase PptA (4-oxalocrotonate tautomerase family)
MPTITIDATAMTATLRRAVAVRLTRWFTRHHIDPAHVIVRFTETPAGSVFSGGFPVDALPATGGPIHQASVSCCLGPDRDDEFRDALAHEIHDALGPVAFLAIEFRPTPPRYVHVLRAGRLTRADRPKPRGKVMNPC